MSNYDDEDFENVPRNNVSMRADEYRNKQPCTSYTSHKDNKRGTAFFLKMIKLRTGFCDANGS